MQNIYVLIVTYNGMNWIQTCLQSLIRSNIHLNLVVIDNNSTDDTLEAIKENHPDITVIKQKENLGFGAANNIGMRYALSMNADAVFLLNQDTKIDRDTVEKLLYLSDKFSDYGILSPLQLDYSGQFLEECFYYFVTNSPDNSFISDAILGRPLQEIYQVPFVQAASWFIPKRTLKIVGGFDPIFFHYGEDNNYCQRVIYHGLKIGVTPLVRIQHDSTAQLSTMKPLFSPEYFKDYELSIKLKYANVLIDYNYTDINLEIRRNLKSAIKSFIKLNMSHYKGYLKKIKILQKNQKKIMKSRNANILRNENYL
jgi:GT2 family glycosyltransferase